MNAIEDKLEKALESVKLKGPGKWCVVSDKNYTQLYWEADSDELPEMYGDEPWTKWGGNAILAAANVRPYDKSGCECFTQRGHPILYEWVEWGHDEEDN